MASPRVGQQYTGQQYTGQQYTGSQQYDQFGDSVEPLPSPRSARQRRSARNELGSSPRGSYAPPTRGTRAIYLPRAAQHVTKAVQPPPRPSTPKLLKELSSLAPLTPRVPPPTEQPNHVEEAQPAASPRRRRQVVSKKRQVDVDELVQPEPPRPWWWPAGGESPRSLAASLAKQKLAMAPTAPDEAVPAPGPTAALTPAVRQRAVQMADSPFALVQAALRTRAPPPLPPPKWVHFDVPASGGEWRGAPLDPSVIRMEVLERDGNEKFWGFADALVTDCEVQDGPLVQLTPHDAVFKDAPFRFSFGLGRLIEDHEGDAFIVTMRDPAGPDPYMPLREDESLTISRDGVATVELREFCWVKTWCFRSDNQDNDVADLIRKLFSLALDADGDGFLSAEELAAGFHGRDKREGDEAKRLGYIGINAGTEGYLIPGVAAIKIEMRNGARVVRNNPELAQRTAKEFSADSPIKALAEAIGGQRAICPAPPSDGDGNTQEKLQVGFRENVVPDALDDDEEEEEVREEEGAEAEEAAVPEKERSAAAAADPKPAGGKITGPDDSAPVRQSEPVPPETDPRTMELISSARQGHEDRIQSLLSSGVDVNSTDGEGRTALMVAAGAGYASIVDRLLEAGAEDRADARGRTALMMAAFNGQDAAVGVLTPKVDLDKVDSDGNTALINAAGEGHTEVVTQLVESGADMNRDGGETALHAAAEANHSGAVAALLQGRADPDKVDRFGNTALMNAAERGHETIVSMLLEGGAKADLEGSVGQTALMKAAKHNRSVPIAALVAASAALDKVDDSGNSALMLAAAAGHAAIVSQLLGVGAEWDLENSNGKTALDLAKSNDGKEASLDKGQGAAQALISHIAQAQAEAEPEPGAD